MDSGHLWSACCTIYSCKYCFAWQNWNGDFSVSDTSGRSVPAKKTFKRKWDHHQLGARWLWLWLNSFLSCEPSPHFWWGHRVHVGGLEWGVCIGGCVWEYVCVSMFLRASLYKYLFVCESVVLLISPSLSISFRSLFIYLFFLFFVLIAGLETHQYLILFLFLSFSSHQSTLLMSPKCTFLEKLNLTSYISGESFKLFPVIRDSFIITGWKIRGKENIMIERKP